MTFTTQDVPIYFPSKPRKEVKYRARKKLKKEHIMRTARLGIKLVEQFHLSPKRALEALIEMDPDKAAELMAAGIKDPEERKKAEMKFKKEVDSMMADYGKEDEVDDDDTDEDDDTPSIGADDDKEDDDEEPSDDDADEVDDDDKQADDDSDDDDKVKSERRRK